MNIPFLDRISKREQRKPIVDVAEIISLLLDPFGTTLLTSLVLMFTAFGEFQGQGRTLVALFIICFLVPLAYLFYGLRTGRIKDLFISDRKERYVFLLITCCVAIIFNLGLWYFGAPTVVAAYSLSALVLAIVITAITFYWKISGHSSVLTMNVLTLIFTQGFAYFWLVLLIPIVAAARLILKVHTLEQVVAGAIVSAIILYSVFSYFGLVQLF